MLRSAVFGLFALSLAVPESAFGATAAPLSPSERQSDRIAVDLSSLPVRVQVNRAIRAIEPRTVDASLVISDTKAKYSVKGSVDTASGKAVVDVKLASETAKVRVVGDSAFVEVSPRLRTRLRADWVEVSLLSGSAPDWVLVTQIVLARPKLLESVTKWKDASTPDDKAKSLRRFTGTGELATLSALEADGFDPKVRVSIWLDRAAAVTRVDWSVMPAAGEVERLDISASYGRGRSVTVERPTGNIVQFDDLLSTPDTEPQ